MSKESSAYIACPPPCINGRQCHEEVLCIRETCPYGWDNWKHTTNCVKHTCAHNFSSGLGLELDGGWTATCICGMTAMSHDMRYGP